jgi:alpha-L-fucosidase 2
MSNIDRMSNFDGLSNNDLPTDLRLLRYKQGEEDMGLISLFYQFGRYLLISSSRPANPLPANLQGLWADGLETPWHGDYHTNINVQMNYWPAGQTNLIDCNIPLVNLIKTLVAPGRKTAKSYYNADGWTVYTITNAWGWTSPGWESAWAQFPCAGAWMCQHLFEHYAYTRDLNYLNEIYPILKENCLFNISLLVEDDDGSLITSPSTSPENSFRDNDGKEGWLCKGNAMDRQIIFDNFSRMINVCEILNKDNEFKEKLKILKDRIKKPEIGKAGQLMEWYGDWDLNAPEPQHRHISHMFALHPGAQISPDTTPELAEACKKSLEMRGDSGTGWSKAWKINFWARLHDGNHAYKLLRELLNPVNNKGYNYSNGGGVYSNLFDAHPPFQIDGNFGATAGITEMLLQSHIMDSDGIYIINLLPALPDLFVNGNVKGLAARGNYTVNIIWQNHSLSSAEIKSNCGGICKIKAHKDVSVLSDGNPVSYKKTDDVICFETIKNKIYKII